MRLPVKPRAALAAYHHRWINNLVCNQFSAAINAAQFMPAVLPFRRPHKGNVATPLLGSRCSHQLPRNAHTH